MRKEEAEKTQKQSLESPGEKAEELAGEVVEQEVRLISPEQAELRKQLTQARKYLQDGKLRQAVALAKTIEERASGAFLSEVKLFMAEALPRLDAALSDVLSQGDTSREEGDFDAAHKYYEEALAIRQENGGRQPD